MKKMFLYGKRSVLERLKVNPKSVEKIWIGENFDSKFVEEVAKKVGIPVVRTSSYKLSKFIKGKNAQGIVAQVRGFTYTPLEDLLSPLQGELSFIFLDRVCDPQNLGAIIRTAACLGKFAVVIPKHRACAITETVLHIASGGENFVPVCLVNNLSRALREVKNKGYWVIGAIPAEGEDITSLQFTFPLGVVLGSEGKGIRYGVYKYVDREVFIPMAGVALSLNVAVACAIFCYEIERQRRMVFHKKGRSYGE